MLSGSRFASVLVNAVRKIDSTLATSPQDFGESRYDPMRVGFEHPFGIEFEVMNDVRTVVVHDIWRTDQ